MPKQGSLSEKCPMLLKFCCDLPRRASCHTSPQAIEPEFKVACSERHDLVTPSFNSSKEGERDLE
eukprot:1996179-Amphidinium_carterae.1